MAANLTGKKPNVLVYTGNGTTVESVRQCLYTLRRLLAPNYAVTPVTGDMITKEPWTTTCALLVLPGGADLGYCRTLNGAGNRRIDQYVRRGGSYLGLCAGGYYGSKRCEFEVGNKTLEVTGSRELGFYPGTCRGGAFPGFVYQSEDGARAAELRAEKGVFKTYYNGGGVFVDAPVFAERGVEVLASYTEDLHVDPGRGSAAVVYCRVGEGAAVLTGAHPEFAPANLNKNAGGPEYARIVEELAAHDKSRTDFMKALLVKLGLQVSQETTTVPSLSSLHLSASDPAEATEIYQSLQSVTTKEDDAEYLKDAADTFRIEKSGTWNMGALDESLPDDSKQGDQPESAAEEQPGDVDYAAIVKRLVIHDDHPPPKTTPCFNHNAFYSNLHHYQSLSKEGASRFGSQLLYAEVITSTNSILEKNTQLLHRLPTGFTATATVQVAGRGRGSNVWVSPAGSLMFSTVVRHPIEKLQSAPVIFIQYLAAMAVVRGIKTYDKGYEKMPVKLKWPNDVYAPDPSDPTNKTYTKICGILITSSYTPTNPYYTTTIGVGLNATNPSPTTSLSALRAHHLPPDQHSPPITTEKLLASILVSFEELYTRFLRTGFDAVFEGLYYADWLHGGQVIRLEGEGEEGGVRVRIRGITRDYGLLVAEEVREGLGGGGERSTGRVWQLQSDSNSFDFLRGLVRRKV